ncbi:hypothetical protein [Bauldia sp.]|uniref:hypothetical protein n=1 Tax=Bauldia sp. TaxID=2575872 RepID=UPI003BAA35BE
MPKQKTDLINAASIGIEFSGPGIKWKVLKDVTVGGVSFGVFSDHDNSTLVNKGTLFGGSSGVSFSSGANMKVINKADGTIFGSSFGIDVSSVGLNSTIENYGKVLSGAFGVNYTGPGDLDFKNEGIVQSTSFAVTVNFNDSAFRPKVINNGLIEGGFQGLAVQLTVAGDGRAKITNGEDGIIKGGLTTSQADGAAIFTNAKVKLTNKGAIEGVVSLDNSRNDKVINEGKIKGDVYLGDGNDTFDNRDGKTKGYIFAQEGKDKLIAGDKKEKFVFDNLPDSDRVKNFESGKDKFFLDPAEFNGLSLGPLEKSAFRRGTEAEDGDDRIIYDKESGKLYADLDGVGGNGPDQFAKVDPGQKLKYSDFIIDTFV